MTTLTTGDERAIEVWRRTYAELEERTPKPGSGWRRLSLPPMPETGTVLARSAWFKGPLRAISSLILADLPNSEGIGPQWLVSLSRDGKRPKPHDVRTMLRAFGMEAAENDQHHPGIARHFFLVVDKSQRVSCECKATEEVIVEPDGYKWTTPRGSRENPAICRGCEMARMRARMAAVGLGTHVAGGRTCSLHPAAAGSDLGIVANNLP